MTRLLVAALYVWDEYPGLRAGRIFAGKGDIGTHPRGETHAVASADSLTTVCGQPREKYPYAFADSVSLVAADACPDCRIGSDTDLSFHEGE